MARRLAAAAFALVMSAPATFAQQQPIPLLPAAPPRSVVPEPLPPLEPGPKTPVAARPPTEANVPPPAEPGREREFCGQPVTVRLADRDAVPERYRAFVGMWSDAAWTPQLCAALIVENVAPDGTAAIVYAFGPMGSDARGPGGVLNGTGIVSDGELRFQNSDGSQFAFRPFYADLAGHLTMPQGQRYEAIFKKTL